MEERYQNGKKTLWEKEKLLVTSNFSFSHSVFKRLVSQGHQRVSLCGNGVINDKFHHLSHINCSALILSIHIKAIINLLPNNKILNKSKLKAFADNKLNFTKMTSSLLDRVDNTLGKRRKYLLPEFSPFPTVFSKNNPLKGR